MEKEALLKLFENNTFYLLGEKKSKKPEKEYPQITLDTDPDVGQDRKETAAKSHEPSKRTGLAVLYYYAGEMPIDEKSLLEKILSAVSINLKQSLMHNVKLDNTEIQTAASKYLCFGNQAHQLMAPDSDFYKVIEEEQFTMLFADDLKLIKDNVELKKKLWTALQKMFL